MTAWRFDITARNRDAAIGRLATADLPRLVRGYFIRVLQGERYVNQGAPNPDGPVRVHGAGDDVGHAIYLNSGGLAYL